MDKLPYRPLRFARPSTGVSCFRPRQHMPERVNQDNPAVDVMTDLRQVAAQMVSLQTPLSVALERMIKMGVRLLLVAEADGSIRGVITSRDIQGEKPLRIMEKTGSRREDLVVRDLMTLHPNLEVLLMEDVMRARVGDIIATLRETGRQHALVLDRDTDSGVDAIRGIFSLSQIGQQLGLDIHPSERPTTFAEISSALSQPQG